MDILGYETTYTCEHCGENVGYWFRATGNQQSPIASCGSRPATEEIRWRGRSILTIWYHDACKNAPNLRFGLKLANILFYSWHDNDILPNSLWTHCLSLVCPQLWLTIWLELNYCHTHYSTAMCLDSLVMYATKKTVTCDIGSSCWSSNQILQYSFLSCTYFLLSSASSLLHHTIIKKSVASNDRHY